MSIRVSGVYLVPTSPVGTPTKGTPTIPIKTTNIILGPQRSNSLDYLNFEEKRQIIASSLSLTDFLQHGPAAAAAKGVEATKIIVADSFIIRLTLEGFHLNLSQSSIVTDLNYRRP
ncbi:hypothetical protein RUM44_008438 [Polyplax serrata]|uniref:Uncharacterized protein n=1 Tax=Polyplax serrata TaxID=468196 RepID=A0ABR1BC90_POLSC